MKKRNLWKYKNIILLTIDIINFIYNIKNKYFNKHTFVYDEAIKDPRNIQYEEVLLWSDIETVNKIEDRFIAEPLEIPNQRVEWYRYSCTGQWTWQATNSANKIRVNWQPKRSGFKLFDLMVKLWLANRKRWAYGIDAVKTAKKERYFRTYAEIKDLNEILTSIYNGHFPTLWTNKITWSRVTSKWIVKEIGKWYGHFFYAIWYDKNMKAEWFTWFVKCVNSSWEDYRDWGCFWIPFDLIEKWILFNTKCAIIPFKNK